MARQLINYATLVAFMLTIYFSQIVNAVVNNKIDRIIDLSSQLVKITERIHLDENPGIYRIKLETEHHKNLAYIDASINGQVVDLVEKPDGIFEADLTGQKVAQPLVVTSVYTKLIQPYPSEIGQSERQLVRYQGLQATLSPYQTKTVTTRIKLPSSSRLESFTKASKMTTGTNKLTYGPFKDIQANHAEPLTIHYENNSPFVAVTSLNRRVEVSPWAGNIYLSNQVKVAHVGAKLKGPFSRLEYQRDHSSGLSSVKSFAAELPKNAAQIYFRDGIGNISTSSIKYTSTNSVVILRPRFPLFGGWVTDFDLGYQVRMKDFINEPVSGSNYRLSIPFTDILYENMFIEEALIKVILPAGASNIEVKGSIRFERLQDEVHYSYLDLIGRPVVVFKKLNLVAQHVDGKPLIIRYDYSPLYMLQEVVLLTTAAIGILVVFVFQRFCSCKTV